jgi:hypothetical protein
MNYKGWSMSALIVVVLEMVIASNAFAQGPAKRVCTRQEADQADTEIDSLKDWDHVHRWYQMFSQCDDGAMAEGYSDAVSKLLADDWDHFNRLLALTKTDKQFQRFVLRHIDGIISPSILQKITSNAKSKCPPGGESLCRLIVRTANTR